MVGSIEKLCVAASYVTPAGKVPGTFTTLNTLLVSTSLALVKASIVTVLAPSATDVQTVPTTGASFVPLTVKVTV